MAEPKTYKEQLEQFKRRMMEKYGIKVPTAPYGTAKSKPERPHQPKG